MDYSTKEAEMNNFTDKLNEYAKVFDGYANHITPEGVFMKSLEELESADLSSEPLFNKMIAYFNLGCAYNNIKLKKNSYVRLEYADVVVTKEIAYFRKCLRVITHIFEQEIIVLIPNAKRFQSRTYLYLANAYDHIGRFAEAQQFYHLALCDSSIVREVEINLGFSWGNTHSYYFEQEPLMIAHVKECLSKYSRYYKEKYLAFYNHLIDLPAPSVEVDKNVIYAYTKEDQYSKWINANYLRLNRYNDISPFSIFAQKDNLNLPKIETFDEDEYYFYKSFFDEISTMFIICRKWLYESLHQTPSAENVERVKCVFLRSYSILDKISAMLNRYMKLEIPMGKTDFSQMWFERKGKVNGIRDKIKVHDTKLALIALYNVRCDLFGSKVDGFEYDEHTQLIREIRNYLEHRSVLIQDGEYEKGEYQIKISYSELGKQTIRLMQLIRCAIIYVCNFVLHEEYDRNVSCL